MSTKDKPAVSIEAAFTRPSADRGVLMEVIAPDGTKLGTITVRGSDSEAFESALWRKSRANARIMGLPEAERPEARREAELQLIASLVADWDFAEPCTQENIVRLLINAPYIYNQIDETAGKRVLFWHPKTE